MSWRDRPYAADDSQQPELRIQFRRPSTAVMWLIVANVIVFFLNAIAERIFPGTPVQAAPSTLLLGLSLDGIGNLYLWQPLTYMFMHGGIWHILLNMIGLYIFGSEFERAFGRDRFLQFYGICAIMGGLAYLVLSAINRDFAPVPLIGASGAVYGLLIAAIIFFPHLRVILIIFPMPVRVLGLIIVGILLLQLISGNITNPGGEVCHIAGAAAGVATLYAWGMMPRIRFGSGGGGGTGGRFSEGAWERRQRKLAEEQAEVDRILEKVHREGIQSLTRRERRTLTNATRRQRERDKELGRIDRL